MRTLIFIMIAAAGCAPDDLDAQLSAEQLSPEMEEAVLARLSARRLESTLPPGDVRVIDLPELRQAVALPKTIKVWRRGLDGSSASCSGRVDTIAFEEYVKGVLPHEWIVSWDVQSLRAGAIAIRTYAWYWVAAGGKYTCADIDDTTSSQVYKDARNAKASAAVDITAGQVVTSATGAPVFAEYSAENSDPTKDGVSEPHCTGKALFGHGRGMCQWGTQRWALAGKDYTWMVAHYYPGKTLQGAKTEWAAALGKTQPPPAEMTSGEEAVVWIEYQNAGAATWSITDTRIGTTMPRDRASAFIAPQNWISPSRPTGADHSYAPGATGRFSFVMRAPDVQSDTTFVEHFGLVQENVAWFGPKDDAVKFTILVHPRSGPVPPGPQPPNPSDPQTGEPGETTPPTTEVPTGGSSTGGCSMAPNGTLDPLMFIAVLSGVLLFRKRRDS
jgi:hypothetical protein